MPQQAIAQPKSVLRGHRTQVHITTFIRSNQRLASGDADGFVVLWDLTIMRPRAVWRAHASAILGISGWGDDKLITEGRDNRLIVWKITCADEAALSTALPLDESAPERPQPWILNILEINTMNFCSFTSCASRHDMDRSMGDELLVAVPNTLATEAIDIYHIPSQTRQATVHLGNKTEKKGMVMALSLFWLYKSLFLVAGYENGLAVVARRRGDGSWDILYKHQAHSQPILSLDVSPNREYFLTSGADAIIAKHPIPNMNLAGPIPVGTKTEMPETTTDREASPLKTIKTKHSGQQGLQIRSDGRIFATAGWDSKIRVYSAKSMAELAVLKWHDVGCYAAAFSVLADDRKDASDGSKDIARKGTVRQPTELLDDSNVMKGNEMAMTTTVRAAELNVKDRRIKMAKEAHWLAAGSKDGKISLWDIY